MREKLGKGERNGGNEGEMEGNEGDIGVMI